MKESKLREIIREILQEYVPSNKPRVTQKDLEFIIRDNILAHVFTEPGDKKAKDAVISAVGRDLGVLAKKLEAVIRRHSSGSKPGLKFPNSQKRDKGIRQTPIR